MTAQGRVLPQIERGLPVKLEDGCRPGTPCCRPPLAKLVSVPRSPSGADRPGPLEAGCLASWRLQQFSHAHSFCPCACSRSTTCAASGGMQRRWLSGWAEGLNWLAFGRAPATGCSDLCFWDVGWPRQAQGQGWCRAIGRGLLHASGESSGPSGNLPDDDPGAAFYRATGFSYGQRTNTFACARPLLIQRMNNCELSTLLLGKENCSYHLSYIRDSRFRHQSMP